MFVDNYIPIHGDQYDGGVVESMRSSRFDSNLRRPYIDSKGQPSIMVNTGQFRWNKETKQREPVLKKMALNQAQANGLPMVNNATLLRKDEWQMLDTAVVRAARQRLRAWSDLAAANSFGGFDGMSKMILEHETMSDPGEAIVDMDGLTDGRTDTPTYQLEGLPLPITHSDFWFSSRRLAVSRNTGTPLDTTMAEAAGRRVAESVEKVLIGVDTGATYGVAADYGRAPTVFGYTNFPDRVTKTNLTAPDGTNGTTVLTEWLAFRDQMYAQKFYGPFIAYTHADYDQYLDDEFKTNSDKSLRQRLLEIDGISAIRRLDFMDSTFSSTFDLLFVQMTPEVARAVIGMNITTVQWESQGGMRSNFKVMGILVPQLRADRSGNCGIGHATTS